MTGPREAPARHRTLAIIGANGQLGQALTEVFSRPDGWRIVPLTHADIEITEAESIARALDPAPDFLINTAYWADEDPVMALRVNALGARRLAEFCATHGTFLAHMSTDYVFDGETDRSYRETDRPNPRSVYGISKLAGEHMVAAALPRHLIVRISSLYGAGGSRAKKGTSFVSDMLDMHRQGKTIRVVTDQFHSPTYAQDAAAALVELLGREVTGTVHLSNSGVCSKFDFAQRVFDRAGLRADLVPITRAELPQNRHWPRYTALAHDALHAAGIPLPRPWEEGLAAHLRREGIA